MKATFEKLLLPAGILLTGTALAIEPPPDDAPPPAPAAAPAAAPEAEAQATGFLGVSTHLVPDMLAFHLELPENSGVLVRAVVPGSPAEQAGIELHDVITLVNGEAVTGPDHLTARIHQHRPGDELTLKLIHKGKTVER